MLVVFGSDLTAVLKSSLRGPATRMRNQMTKPLNCTPGCRFLRMEKEKPFNFKLLVPPRIRTGQVSAVTPQQITSDTSGFMQPLQTFNKCLHKDFNMPYTSMVAPSKSLKTDAAKKISVMPMEKEEKILPSSELCSKLFEEVEKINCWKFGLESEIAQKDKLLHETKKTIENQRKAIQELQFENENLSMKLENEMCEKAELKNKSSATRNLCSILKDAFEKTVEKMNLFESERLETHNVFLQNNETIQGTIRAFEGLHVQAESDRLETLKLKEELQRYEGIEKRFQEECKIKQDEVVILLEKMNDKDKKLQEIAQNFQDKQQDCFQFQEAARQQYEMLQISKQEQEQLLEKLQTVEQAKKESEEKGQSLENALQYKEMEYAKVIAEKDSSVNALKIKNEQMEKIQTAAQEAETSLRLEKERTKELEEVVNSIAEELKIKTSQLGETVQQTVANERQIQILREDMDVMSKSIIVLEEKLQTEKTKVSQLDMDLKSKNAEIYQLLAKAHTTSVAKEFVENALSNLEEELKDVKEIAVKRETEMCEMREKLSVAQMNELKLKEENDLLKKNVQQHEEEYRELMAGFSKLQAEKEIITQAESSTSEAKESKVEEKKTEREIQRLKEENCWLRGEVEPLRLRVEEQDEKMMAMQEKYEDCNQSLQKEVVKKEKLLKSLEIKLNASKVKIENKAKAHYECQRENKTLKKQLATEQEKCNKLETEVKEMKEECTNIQRLNSEKLKKLQADIEMNAATEAKLHKKVEKLNREAQEADRSKEEIEIKCQHKISDMVALMEKHKDRYDKMVEEKDAELDNRKMKEAEVNASYTSLVLELSETKIENSNLMQQLENEAREMDKLREEISVLNLKMNAMQQDMKKKESGRGNLKTLPWNSVKMTKSTPQIKSYRIRTPPSTEKSMPWIKSVLEFDPKSDSSEQNDLQNFSVDSEPLRSVKKTVDHGMLHHQKSQSPTLCKSLKLAAVKRMRDAGWTAVTSADVRKRQKASEKIFA